MEIANKPQTERKRPPKLFAGALAILLILLDLMKWAWEELNFRPHAYQAFRSKSSLHGFRTLLGVRSGRLLLYRKEPASDRSEFRKQNANTKAGRWVGSAAFWTLAASFGDESKGPSAPAHFRPLGCHPGALNGRSRLALMLAIGGAR